MKYQGAREDLCLSLSDLYMSQLLILYKTTLSKSVAFGKFFIKSTGEVNAIMFGPKGFCCFSLLAL
jgi:hypothetical protein